MKSLLWEKKRTRSILSRLNVGVSMLLHIIRYFGKTGRKKPELAIFCYHIYQRPNAFPYNIVEIFRRAPYLFVGKTKLVLIIFNKFQPAICQLNDIITGFQLKYFFK